MHGDPAWREVAVRGMARAVHSPFAKPIARVVVAAAGLALLAMLGRTSAAVGSSSPAVSDISPGAGPAGWGTSSSGPLQDAAPSASPPIAATASLPSSSAPASAEQTSPAPSSRASPDDPVVLNTATVRELRRLPGIGDKKANAILSLRAHLGRFRAVEDLLKVKGVGRATLKRLRPLVRLDPQPSPDAGGASR